MVSFGCWGRWCVAHSATLQKKRKKEKKKSEILPKRLLAGTSSVSICHLRCHPPAALISAEGLPQLTGDSPPEPWSNACRIYARAEPPLHTFIRRISKVWRCVSGAPWWGLAGVWESSCRRNQELLFCRSSVWDFHTGVKRWSDASSSQLITELQLQSDSQASFDITARTD